jgi:hypothetical protein
MLWWSMGLGDEVVRFNGHVQDVDVASVVRSRSGTPCIIKQRTVAENTFDLLHVFSKENWPPLKNHELGRRLAEWSIEPLEV